jgi:hypothetical protein
MRRRCKCSSVRHARASPLSKIQLQAGRSGLPCTLKTQTFPIVLIGIVGASVVGGIPIVNYELEISVPSNRAQCRPRNRRRKLYGLSPSTRKQSLAYGLDWQRSVFFAFRSRFVNSIDNFQGVPISSADPGL